MEIRRASKSIAERLYQNRPLNDLLNSSFTIRARGHLEAGLEGAVEVGEVCEAGRGRDGEDAVVGGAEGVGGEVQAVVVQEGDEALTGHLAEPAHEVAAAEGADRGGILDTQGFGVVGCEPLQDRL